MTQLPTPLRTANAKSLPDVCPGRWPQAKQWLRENGLTRHFAVDSGWAVTSEAFGVLASLVETFLLARILGVSNFGILMLMTALVSLVYGILDCRSGEVVIKYLPELKRAGGTETTGALLRTNNLNRYAFGRYWIHFYMAIGAIFRPLVVNSG